MDILEGEIDVERCMDYVVRQERMLEWWYLKEYWRADEQDKPIVLALYGKPLADALKKYRCSRHWHSDSVRHGHDVANQGGHDSG